MRDRCWPGRVPIGDLEGWWKAGRRFVLDVSGKDEEILGEEWLAYRHLIKGFGLEAGGNVNYEKMHILAKA